jgi:hypothetical protein
VSFEASSRFADAGGTAVSTTVTTSLARHALAVPVQALLALASAGYAVQRPDGDLIAVKTGPTQNGQIEISGAGVRAGLQVVSVT